jgi:hypothetical protein
MRRQSTVHSRLVTAVGVLRVVSDEEVDGAAVRQPSSGTTPFRAARHDGWLRILLEQTEPVCYGH